MDKQVASYVAGVYESGSIGTSSSEAKSFNQASSKPERIEVLIELTGVGELVEFKTKNEKAMHGWGLTVAEEMQLVEDLRPLMHMPSKIKQAEKWLTGQRNLRGLKEPAARKSASKSAAAKKPTVKRKTRGKSPLD